MKKVLLSILIIGICTKYYCQELTVVIEKQDISCYGMADGIATAIVTGGTEPYEYIWSTFVPEQTIVDLIQGNYTITVEDAVGATATATANIIEPDFLNLQTIVSRNVSCFGYNDGIVEAIAVGGVPFTNEFGSFYEYIWTDGQTMDSITVSAGIHYVTVTDANDCQHIAMAHVDQPESIYVTNPWSGTICLGESFTTYVIATGGLGPYNFVWIGSDNSEWNGDILTVSPVDTTSYQLITTDLLGCFGPLKNITVNVNPSSNIVTTQNICENETYFWQGASYFNDGIYTVEFTNSYGCDSILSLELVVNQIPQQYSIQQIPSNGILQQGESGQISIEGSEIGTVYYITSNGQTVIQEIDGTGEGLLLGSNFTAGTYEIKSTKLSCGCEKIQGTIIFVNQNSVSSCLFSEYKAFPNPVEDVIYFENIPKKTNYEVINSKGEFIECGNLLDNKIDMSSYTSGIYFINLFTENQNFVIKIIVE